MNALIFGCGYLGLEVARCWNNNQNQIFAVTRNDQRAKSLNELGIRPIVADITQPDSLDNLPTEIDVVLFAVGFDRSRYKNIRDVYVYGLQNVLQKLENRSKHLIYISSTGVYGNFDGQWVTETSETNPQRPGGQACLEAETLIQNSEIASRSTILRLAGIYGKNRIPHWSAIQNQQWSKLSPHGHVNLIHVRDAARVVDSVLTQNLSGQLFLVSDGAPPKRVDFYNYIAEQSGTGPIDWTVPAEDKSTQRSSSDKRVSNRKLITMTQYEFLFPDFRSGIADALGTI